MDWVVGLLLLLAGVIIGFFLAKFWLSRPGAVNKSLEEERTIKEVLAKHADDHLAQSRQILDSLQQQCDNLKIQLEAYEGLLGTEALSDNKERLSFFGEHASVFIQNQPAKQRTKRSAAESQPRDFANAGSGLFNGSKNQHADQDKP